VKQRKFGNCNFSVSEIGHGLWGMGDWSGSTDEKSLKALKKSLSLGCTFYDTAWAYGNGRSDALLGRLLSENSNGSTICASKVPPLNMQFPARSSDSLKDIFPKEHVFSTISKIQSALGVKKIDLLQFHLWDDSWVSNSMWQDIVYELKESGEISHFGLSLNRWEPWNGINAIKTGLIDTVQVIYNIFEQSPEDELFPACREYNVGVIARVPLDEGSLSGKFTLQTHFPSSDWRAKYFGSENLPETVARVNKLKHLVPDGWTLSDLALSFVLSNPDVSTVIVGMREIEHVIANIKSADKAPLPIDLVQELRTHRWNREVTPWAN